MGNCYSADHIAEDHINADITYNIEEPQQKYMYRLGTASYRLLGGLNAFYWIHTLPLASAVVQNQRVELINFLTYYWKNHSSQIQEFKLMYNNNNNNNND